MESAPGWEPIDVYTDEIPGHGQRFRGQRHQPIPPPVGPLEHGYRAPTPPARAIERPTFWAATVASADVVLGRLDQRLGVVSGKPDARRRDRQLGTRVLLDWLSRTAGGSWQQRWRASGLDDAGAEWIGHIVDSRLHAKAAGRHQLLSGASELLAMDVIRPSYRWLYAFSSHATWAAVCADRDPDGFAHLAARGATLDGYTVNDENLAFAQLARMLCHNGGRLADITVTDCREAFDAQLAYTARRQTLWYWLLVQHGTLGDDAPRSAHGLRAVGQRSVADLVDGYRIENPGIRALLIDYLHERQAALDYSTLAALTSKLVLLFWRDLELHEPGIHSLHLADEVARRWKDRLGVVAHGKRRVGTRREDPNSILIAVRAFYSDINHWASEDPARWARWAAPNPISGRDLVGQNKQKHRARARMQQRTRELAPLIPALAGSADRQRRHAAELLAAGRAACHGETFTVDGETLTRVVPPADPVNGGNGRPDMVWADTVDGQRRNLGFEEQRVFWGWAIIEVLRHTGIRIEELTEITQRSFVAYTLPSTGETIPLLQIAPSKTDRERLLVVSPDLSEVLTAIIARVRDDRGHVPLLRRYDHAERLHSPPLPFLFQRRHGLLNVMITTSHAGTLIHRIVASSGLAYTGGTHCRPPRTTSAACSPPKPSPPVSRSTSQPRSSAMNTSPPPRPTSPSTTAMSSNTTERSSPVGEPSAPPLSIATSPTTSGTSSSPTSRNAKSNSGSAAGPTPPHASTNTPASDAPSYDPIPANTTGSPRSTPTSSPASKKPTHTAGRARSKASRSASPPPSRNSTGCDEHSPSSTTPSTSHRPDGHEAAQHTDGLHGQHRASTRSVLLRIVARGFTPLGGAPMSPPLAVSGNVRR